MSVNHVTHRFGRNRLVKRLARLWVKVRRRRRISATMRTLHSLDNRMLDDIGMHRNNIRDVAIRLEARKAPRRTAGPSY